MTKPANAQSDPIVDTLNTLVRDLEALQMRVVDLCQGVQVKAKSLSPPDAADAGYLLKHSAATLDETRKELSAKVQLIGTILALRASELAINNPGQDLTVRGKYASATPDIKQRPKLPKRGSDAYKRLLQFCGVTNPLVLEHAIIEFGFNETSNMLVAMAERGLNPPTDALGTYMEAATIFRARKGKV